MLPGANIFASTFDGNCAQCGAAIKVCGARALLSVSAESTFKSNLAAKNGAAISSTTSSITLIDNVSFMDNLVEDEIGDILFADEVAFHRVTNSEFQ